jgi:hypothetical protein
MSHTYLSVSHHLLKTERVAVHAKLAAGGGGCRACQLFFASSCKLITRLQIRHRCAHRLQCAIRDERAVVAISHAAVSLPSVFVYFLVQQGGATGLVGALPLSHQSRMWQNIASLFIIRNVLLTRRFDDTLRLRGGACECCVCFLWRLFFAQKLRWVVPRTCSTQTRRTPRAVLSS